jgi:hypothetical protein
MRVTTPALHSFAYSCYLCKGWVRWGPVLPVLLLVLCVLLSGGTALFLYSIPPFFLASEPGTLPCALCLAELLQTNLPRSVLADSFAGGRAKGSADHMAESPMIRLVLVPKKTGCENALLFETGFYIFLMRID